MEFIRKTVRRLHALKRTNPKPVWEAGQGGESGMTYRDTNPADMYDSGIRVAL
jgi:hypothetical protein